MIRMVDGPNSNMYRYILLNQDIINNDQPFLNTTKTVVRWMANATMALLSPSSAFDRSGYGVMLEYLSDSYP